MGIYSFVESFSISQYGLGAAIAVVMVRDHVRRHVRLHPPDGADRGGASERAGAPPRAASRSRAPARAPRRLVNLLGLVVFFVMVFPVYWMVATAFKPGNDILSLTPQWFPRHPTLAELHATRSHRPYFWDDVRNSLIIVGVVVALSLVLALPRGARAGEVPLLRAQARSSC